MDRERWDGLMDSLGFPDNGETFRKLEAAYAEPHRHYHTGRHVDACLRHLDRGAEQAERPLEVELALWFHDAVYQPFSCDNEKKSAEWAEAFLMRNAAPRETADRVRRLIMATEHDAPPGAGDESLIVDVDLAILGADPETFAAFETAVRKEYWMVPGFLYRRKRKEILKGFLDRSRIYHNEPYRSELEPRARRNLSRALRRL